MADRRNPLPFFTLAALLAAGLCAVPPVQAATTSQHANSITLSSIAPDDWTPNEPARLVGAPDDQCTAAVRTGPWFEASFLGFGIPGTDVLTGIEVRLNYFTTGTSHSVRLKDSGSFVGDTKNPPMFFIDARCSNTGWVSVGGDGDLWNAGLSISDFNSGNVSFRFTASGAQGVDADAVELIVHHSPPNTPPVAAAGGPYSGPEGSPIAVSGAGSSDDKGVTLYEWDCEDDGTFDFSSASPAASCTYPDNGSFTVRLRVTDAEGETDEDTASMTVSNVAPSVGAVTSPSPSDEGQAVTASATFSDPGTADTHTCTVDYGDGSGPQAGTVAAGACTGPAHVYVDDDPTGTPSDSYTVTVAVTDDDGDSGSNTGSHTVDNVAPTVNAVSVTPEPSDEGEAVTASATFSDPGSADTHTCTVDYGDGSGPQAGTVAAGECTGPSHVYVDDDPTGTASDTYTVIVEVTDDDTGSGSNSGSHTVNNVAPTVGAVTVSPEPSDEGSAVTASADFSDPGSADTHSCTVDYGDGEGPAAGTVSGTTCSGPSHTYADNGSYTVVVEVTDDDTGSGSSTAVHVVDNVDPTITATTNSAADCGDTPEGGLVEIAVDFSDPGFDKAIAGTLEDFDGSTIDWGDGFVETATVTETPGGVGVLTTGTASGSHTYSSGGIYTITVTLIDDDGGSASTTTTALVTGAGLTPAGLLGVVGTDFKDVVNIQRKGAGIEVMALFLGPGKATFPLVDVASMQVLVCDGDDQVHVNHDVPVPAILEGGDGDDHLRAGGGPTALFGDAGDDHLWGGRNDDDLDGGEGDDSLKGGKGNDILIGGFGNDALFGQQGDDLLDGGPDIDRCHAVQGNDTVLPSCEETASPEALGLPASEGG